MYLKRLQTFVHAAERGSFSEAAELMNMTQSGVSRQVKTLEEELGVHLFERRSTAVELTSAGRFVLNAVKHLMADWDKLVLECASYRHELSGTLRIGASTIPASSLLPAIMGAMHDKYPRIEFTVVIEDSSAILSKLHHQLIDLAVIGKKPEHARLTAHCIAEDRLVLIGSSSHPHLQSLADLKAHPVIIREKGSGTREAADSALRQHGIEPEGLRPVAEVSSTETILSMVEAGIGLSIVSAWALYENRHPKIKILHELPTSRCFYLGYDLARKSHPAIQAFAEETMAIYGKS